MSKLQASMKAAEEAAKWAREQAILMAGRERMSQGLMRMSGKAPNGAWPASTSEALKEAKRILESAKGKAKWLKANLPGYKDTSKGFPRPEQTLGLFDPQDLLGNDPRVRQMFEKSGLDKKGTVGGIRRFVGMEADPKRTAGYVYPKDKRLEMGRVLAQWEPGGTDLTRDGMTQRVFNVKKLDLDEAGAPLAVNQRITKTPHDLIHTTAHESQHLARQEKPYREQPQVWQDLAKGRAKSGYSWGYVPSEVRAENFADFAAGAPKRKMTGEFKTMAMQNLERRIPNFMERLEIADSKADVRKNLTSFAGDIATRQMGWEDPRKTRAYNAAMRADHYPELQKRISDIDSSLGAKRAAGGPAGKMAGIPARAVERAEIAHDAQAMLDHARASLSNPEYSEYVKRIKPVLNDRVPGLRYGIAATAGVGYEEMKRAKQKAQEKR